MTRQSTTRTYIGANIKGTPSMPAAAVRHDLRHLRDRADVMGLQEFRWPWYWRVLGDLLAVLWGSYPSAPKGIAQPVAGAQGILWKRALWRRAASRMALLHPGAAGISEDRYLRAVLLVDRATRLRSWYASTHFVVGGDSADDGGHRQAIMRHDLAQLDRFLTMLRATGHPVVMELDGNVRPGTWAYRELTAILERHGATLHGEHGVEYAFTIHGVHTRVVVTRAWTVPTSQLRTDHEARCLDHHLVSRTT